MNAPFSIADVWLSLRVGSPLLALMVAAMAVLVVDGLTPASRRAVLARRLPMMTLGGLALAWYALIWVGCEGVHGRTFYFSGMMQTDYLVFLAQNVILGGAVLLLLLIPGYLEGRAVPLGEFYALYLLAVMGMAALAASSELLTLFLNLEVLSIALYVLTGIEKRRPACTEAAFKYFLLGSFASAFLLFGIALMYGATGQTRLTAIVEAVRAPTFDPAAQRLLIAGVCLALVGFGFKLTLAPFHMYAPDVYDGAPTPIAALIATGSKVAGFCALFTLIGAVVGIGPTRVPFIAPPPALPYDASAIGWMLYLLAAAGMIVGNVGAVVQPRFKRLLAYSSIAHSGYLMVPLVVMVRHPEHFAAAREATAYYLLAYALMTLLAFAVAISLGAEGEGVVADYAGLARRSPLRAAAMALAMVSLIGIPPTLGFFGKWQVFAVAVAGGEVALAILAFLASVASAYYYLGVTVTMYMQPPAEGAAPARSLNAVTRLVLAAGVLGLFVFAVYPNLFLFGP